jgi:hypothetical protein
MKPASSESTYGRASSAINADAVAISRLSGIKSFNWAVCEALDFRDAYDFLAGDSRDGLRCCGGLVGPPRLCFDLRTELGKGADVCCTGRGCGREGGGCSLTSSKGTEKQKQNSSFCVFFCRVLGGCLGMPLLRPLPPCWFLCADFRFGFSCSSTKPNRSASVSILVRPSSIGVAVARGPGLDRADSPACSLCCQQ